LPSCLGGPDHRVERVAAAPVHLVHGPGRQAGLLERLQVGPFRRSGELVARGDEGGEVALVQPVDLALEVLHGRWRRQLPPRPALRASSSWYSICLPERVSTMVSVVRTMSLPSSSTMAWSLPSLSVKA